MDPHYIVYHMDPHYIVYHMDPLYMMDPLIYIIPHGGGPTIYYTTWGTLYILGPTWTPPTYIDPYIY